MIQIRFAADFKMKPNVPENYPDYAREVASLVKNDPDIRQALKDGWPPPSDEYRVLLDDKNYINILRKKQNDETIDPGYQHQFQDGMYKILDWGGRKGFFRAEPLKKFIFRRIAEGKELAFELFSAAQNQKDLKEDFKEFL